MILAYLVQVNVQYVLVFFSIISQIVGSLIVLWRVSVSMSRYVFRLEALECKTNEEISQTLKQQVVDLQEIKLSMALLLDREKQRYECQ